MKVIVFSYLNFIIFVHEETLHDSVCLCDVPGINRIKLDSIFTAPALFVVCATFLTRYAVKIVDCLLLLHKKQLCVIILYSNSFYYNIYMKFHMMEYTPVVGVLSPTVVVRFLPAQYCCSFVDDSGNVAGSRGWAYENKQWITTVLIMTIMRFADGQSVTYQRMGVKFLDRGRNPPEYVTGH